MTEDKARELKSLADELGFSFNNGDLLSLAFVHSSYVNENPEAFPESNERLEFLEDALVGLFVAHELYQRVPKKLKPFVGAFEGFMATAGHRSYIGEIKRPQPPWPKGAV